MIRPDSDRSIPAAARPGSVLPWPADRQPSVPSVRPMSGSRSQARVELAGTGPGRGRRVGTRGRAVVGEENAARLLLEGRPGIGKSIIARRLVGLLQQVGVPVAGFTTQELRGHGRREGSTVESVAGERAVLAHVSLPGPHRVSRYGVDLRAFERIALPALRPPGPGGVVVVDEVGRMELFSAAFRDAVTDLLGQDVALVATVQAARHPFTDALKRRPDVQVVRVTEANRDAAPEQLAARLARARSGWRR
jgi:nucleoside-triphosphatase